MKKIIQFHILKGEKQYVASGIDLPIVTQSENLDGLARNIEEAVALHLEGENLAELGFAPEPSVLMSVELPPFVHA